MSSSFLLAALAREADVSASSSGQASDPSVLHVPPDDSEWAPEELGCLESGWHGLPAQSLFVAVRDGNSHELEQLLSDMTLCTRINDCDQDGFGLLHHSIETAPCEVMVQLIECLLTRRADIELRNGSAETPLILAAGHGRHEAVACMLSRGASLDAADEKGLTALMRAEARGLGWQCSPLRPHQPNPKRVVELLEAAGAGRVVWPR